MHNPTPNPHPPPPYQPNPNTGQQIWRSAHKAGWSGLTNKGSGNTGIQKWKQKSCLKKEECEKKQKKQCAHTDEQGRRPLELLIHLAWFISQLMFNRSRKGSTKRRSVSRKEMLLCARRMRNSIWPFNCLGASQTKTVYRLDVFTCTIKFPSEVQSWAL